MERHASWGYCGVKWLRKQCENNKKNINSLWPRDTACRHRSGSTFVQIMACCLRAPSHYLNQRWLIISEVQWYSRECNFIRDTSTHSVESPSMVDSQWDIWYWGSKWNLHTVCWSAVGCEWGTTSVTLGLLMFALSLVDFLSLLLSPSTYFKFFYFCQKYHLKDVYKIFKKFHVGLKFEWGL